jgi:hypothetical protein
MSRIDTINKIYGSNIAVSINDIKNDADQPAGTRVKVEFPPDLD